MFHQCFSELELAHIFSRLGLSDDDFKDCLAILREDHAPLAVGVLYRIVAIVKRSCAHANFTTYGLAYVCDTGTGSRVGDPLGDLIYNFGHVRILHQLHERPECEGLVEYLPLEIDFGCFLVPSSNAHSVPVYDDTFVDGADLLSSAKNAFNLYARTERMIQFTSATLAQHGLRLRWGLGKSDVLLCFYVDGADHVNQIVHIH